MMEVAARIADTFGPEVISDSALLGKAGDQPAVPPKLQFLAVDNNRLAVFTASSSSAQSIVTGGPEMWAPASRKYKR
jgi:hypothetical protein